MECFDQGAQTEAGLFGESPQRDAVLVMPEDDLADPLVADQSFRQHPGGRGLHRLAAVWAILPLQPVEDAFRIHRLAVEDGALAEPLRLQDTATLRTGGIARAGFDPIGPFWIQRPASVPDVADWSPAPLGSAVL